VEIWKCGNMEMWKYGNVEIWKCGNVIYYDSYYNFSMHKSGNGPNGEFQLPHCEMSDIYPFPHFHINTLTHFHINTLTHYHITN
jgi:hypothetical protein